MPTDLYAIEISTLSVDGHLTIFVESCVMDALVEPDKYGNPSTDDVRTAIQVMLGRIARIACIAFVELNRVGRGRRFGYQYPPGDVSSDELGDYAVGFFVSVPMAEADQWLKLVHGWIAEVRSVDRAVFQATEKLHENVVPLQDWRLA